MSGSPLLEAENITREYQRAGGVFNRHSSFLALKGVSFSVEKGRTMAVVGESGCGKSTLARIISMIDVQTSGSLKLAGKEINISKHQPDAILRKMVQIVFQNPYGSLNPRQKIGEALMEPLAINEHFTKAERMRQVYEMLARVAMDRSAFERYPHMFSGGQRQRIAIARALMLRPKLLVLDEPVSALDLSVQAQVLNLLKELQDELELTYIFISHDLSVVHHIADEVMVMYFGEVVEKGKTNDVFTHPQHDYTKMLLKASPKIDVAAIKQRLENRQVAL